MEMTLPESIQTAVKPLFDALPLKQAMSQLVVTKPGPTDLVASIVADPALKNHPALRSGLWLYVDQLDRSHDISQSLKNQTGSFWHGIMHRREGDFGNSHYWFRQTGHHPAMDTIDGYDDGHAFIDRVEAAYRDQGNQKIQGDQGSIDSLLDLQRREWVGLFQWCANAAYDAG